MRLAAPIAVFLLALIPLTTLVHRNDRGRWEVQRSAMASPDEFAYLLLADNLLHGGGLDLQQTVGHGTFYPPGYPLLLAGWARITGGALTAASAHTLNALLLCADTWLAYFLSRRLFALLAGTTDRHFRRSDSACRWLAILITGLFAANWHILGTALLVMSEPAFMLVTFAWILLVLREPDWHLDIRWTVAAALLATAAWSIRSAGMVCVAATLLFPLLGWRRAAPQASRIGARCIVAALLVLFIAAVYQITLTRQLPAPTPAVSSDNSYLGQLEFGYGLRRLQWTHLADWGSFLATVRDQVMNHFDDFAASFVPWPREEPDSIFRVLIGRIVAVLALLGWLYQAIIKSQNAKRNAQNVREAGKEQASDIEIPQPAMGALQLYLALYFVLYLIWPFRYERFWSPILPPMLVFAAEAVMHFAGARRGRCASALALILLSLLLALTVEEDLLQLHNYARRLNYVSDCLSTTAHFITGRSADPARTIIAVRGEDHFVFAWYLRGDSRYLPRSPADGESAEQMLRRFLSDLRQDPQKRVFLISYFGHGEVQGILSNLRRGDPEGMSDIESRKVLQKEIITAVWEIRFAPPPSNPH